MNEKIPGKRIVGVKQTIKALKSGLAKSVYIARDADEKIIRPLIEECERCNVEIVYIATMEKLGSLCGISVGAAAACTVNE